MKIYRLGILAVFVCVVWNTTVFAQATSRLQLEIQQSPVVQGDLFDVVVEVVPDGSAIDTVRTVLVYNPALVQVQDVQLSGRFERAAPGNYRNNQEGVLSWGAFTLEGPVTQESSVLKVTFLAVETGDAQIVITADSKAISNGVETLDVTVLEGIDVRVDEQTEDNTEVFTIQSSTHPSSVSWYPSTSADFSWTTFSESDSFSDVLYSFGQDPTQEPTQAVDASLTSITTAIPDDGVWYFRLKGVYDDGRETAVSSYLIRSDSTVPNPIELTALEDQIIEGESLWLTFATTDETSGVAGYQVAVNDEAFENASSPLEISDLVAGTYFYRVVAVDRAGNSTFQGVSVRVYPEGTILSRADGYVPASEVVAVTSALKQPFLESSSRTPVLMFVIVCLMTLFGILYVRYFRNHQ